MGSIPRVVLALLTVAGAATYLRDPAWIGGVTSGCRPWEEDPPGTRFHWTAGRASFFIPSDASAMTLPLRAVFPGAGGAPVTVDIGVDDRYLATIELRDPTEWVRPSLPVARATSRRHRRVDLHVSRVVPPFMLGVMVGEPSFERPIARR